VTEVLSGRRADYAAQPDGLPVRLGRYVTAWQPSPLALVLAGAPPPGESDPYLMTHPAFLVGWEDGRTLLVDAGLTPSGAAEFGRPLDWVGADGIVCAEDALSRLASDAGDGVDAAVLTHLHVDHLDGLAALCETGRPVPVALSPGQHTTDERFERAGLEALDALEADDCIRRTALGTTDPQSPAPGLAGFRGVHRVAVPGHTPGSVLWVLFLHDPAREEGLHPVVVAGDVVNHRAGFRLDRPKPWWYRRLLVREDDAVQAASRRLLARLHDAGFEILVNHHLRLGDGPPVGVPCTDRP
jgi:glyoxylase-like metal-dependent hydrolase (beta-lactamase superfamily II)